MNNRPDDRTRLLADSLHGDWTSGPAAAMARRAAVHARRRRGLKHASLVLTAAAAIAAGILVSHRARPPVTPTPSPGATLGYEIISDDELVAQLKDRPLLVLPQENGAKKIVLLDR